MKKVCFIEAPCKINLHLAVGGKRPDGFHSIESLFAPLSLSDTLELERKGEKNSCRLTMDWEEAPEAIPPEENLVFKAVSLFRERAGYEDGLAIRVKKRIPAGSGLGGASSDAASALLALNSLAGSALPGVDLLEMAALLGSDVPFFFIGGAAFVSGRGEFIEPVKTPEGLCVVLAKPPFPSATAEAFALLDQARADNQSRKTRSLSKEALIKALEGGDPREWPFWNDFLPVFLDSSPEGKALAYQSIMESFYREGASFAGLSGSGSCCFGVFAARETGEKALKTFLARGNYARLTFFLARIAKPVLK